MKQAERMEAALDAAGGDVERLVLTGRNHFPASYAGDKATGRGCRKRWRGYTSLTKTK